MSSNNSLIQLARMPQQAGVRAPEDDWTGVTDQAERRKLQNRINQRTYRLRQQLGRNKDDQSQEERGGPSTSVSSHRNIHAIQSERSENEFKCTLAPPNAGSLMRDLEGLALGSYLQSSPNLDHLLALSKLNIQRAIIDNTRLMGMTMDWMNADDALSIFNVQISGFSEQRIPPSLRPTEVQRRIPHHPWLDFFPFPNLRDNLIAVQDEIDDDELCHDLMAFWDTRNTGATLLVWGLSHDPRNWEVTEAFVRKWGFLLVGCQELLRSSNYWRAKRGERPLIWKHLSNKQ
ncbi:hypothetical protein N7454_009808 [Penicillium verhagenii]|nr:hypothetical protein N7454_009808 [Penicillium verhagenii]